MKSMILALILTCVSAPAFAAARLSADCKAGIERDLHRQGYRAQRIVYLNTIEGACDGQTCSTDTLKVYVEALRGGNSVDLVLEVSGPAKGDPSCRLTGLKIAR